MLSATGVRRRYGSFVALDGIDLTIGPGEIVALLGRNGAGKTTLTSVLAGLSRPDEGTVTLDGVDLYGRGRRRRRIGLAPQEIGVYPVLSPRENLELFAALGGVPRAAVAGRIEAVAEAMGLAGLLGRSTFELSGGQKRRLHAALALVHDPQVVLLDEPTAGSDAATRSELIRVLRELSAEGTSICYTTHYFPEVEELGARIVMLDRGRIIASGSIDELVAAHSTAMVDVRFRSPVPIALGVPTRPSPDGTTSTLRVPLSGDRSVPAALLDELGDLGQEVAAIEVVRPSLEAVFLAITGERFDEEDPT